MTEKMQLNEIQKKLLQEQGKDLVLKGNHIFNSLVNESADMHGKLPEPLFVKHFLPVFAGEVSSKENQQALGNWISIAGTPMNEVDIIDNTGKVLFSVPPLFNTAVIDITNRANGRSLADIFKEYVIRNANIPSIAERKLADAIEDKLNQSVDSGRRNLGNEERWMSIFERYGKVTIDNSSNIKPQDLDSDIEYD